jgi:hypothetical protein
MINPSPTTFDFILNAYILCPQNRKPNTKQTPHEEDTS